MSIKAKPVHPKPLKIAIFSGSIPSSTFIEALITGLAEHHKILLFGVMDGHKTYASSSIIIIKTPRSHLANLLVSFCRTLLLLFKHPKNLLSLFKEVKTYNKFYDQWIWYSKFLPIVLYRPDVFHIQWARDLEFYSFLKTRFDIPLVVSLRGAHINYTPVIHPHVAIMYKATFPMVDAFHAVSKAISNEAQNYGDISSRTQVIHSPVPRCFFDAYSLLQKRQKSTIELVSVGRFHWKKGYRYAFDCLKLLKNQGYDVTYTLVGPNSIPEDINFQIEQLHLRPFVTVKPSMNQDELCVFLKNKAVMLLPSIEEGIANVVLEAMAVGLPVISTNCGGMSEVVIPNETGWLVPVREPQAMANAVVEILELSEAELQRITQNAHDFVKAHFNAIDSIEQFEKLYARVLRTDN